MIKTKKQMALKNTAQLGKSGRPVVSWSITALQKHTAFSIVTWEGLQCQLGPTATFLSLRSEMISMFVNLKPPFCSDVSFLQTLSST